MERFEHGGDIYECPVNYDFSANINPLGIPEAVKTALTEHMDEIAHYPDPHCRKLMEALTEVYQVSKDQIVLGNGATELIYALVDVLKPKKALLLAPSFTGYERALETRGTKIEWHTLSEAQNFTAGIDLLAKLTKDLDIFFLSRPNNPVGDCIELPLLLLVIERCRRMDIFLVLDECFLPFLENSREKSAIAFLEDYSHIFILRAFTKIYALPGVRLGYGLCSDGHLMAALNDRLPEWRISVPAQIAGCAALADKTYLTETLAYLKKERSAFSEELAKLVEKVYPSTANYIFFKSIEGLREKLLKKGVLIRSCDNYNGLDGSYYRVAVRTVEENRIFLSLLKEVVYG